MDQTAVVSESDCCGNGCANCVLDVGLPKSTGEILTGKQNVIATYQKFRLFSKTRHNPKGTDIGNNSEDLSEVFELYFGVTDLITNSNDYVLAIPAGYHVMMRTYMSTGHVCLRPYSPFWVDGLAMEFKILVNLTPGGYMSQYIKDLQVGDHVEFRGPIGSLEYISTEKERCVFIISQGVAIAATIRIVKNILNDEEDLSRVYQVACYKDIEHTYFRYLLRDFNKYWNYESHIYLAHQKCSSDMCKTDECTGKCDWFLKKLWYKEKACLERFSEAHLVDICAKVNSYSKFVFIIAGSKKFQDFITEIVNKLNNEVKQSNIFLL
uniref:NADH-cytochrome b5 reductase-like n=1 Tax=Ceratitis capitata TaxID=7213 RepID=W8BGH5_CERCA